MKRLMMLHMSDDVIIADLDGGNERLYRPLSNGQAGLRSGVIAGNVLYAVGAYSAMVYCLRLPDLTLLNTYSCVGKYPFKVELQDGRLYVACADSDTVHMFSQKSGEHISSYHTGGYLTAMALSPYCCMLCTANTRRAYLLSHEQLYPIKEMSIPMLPSCAFYDRDKEMFYVCGTADDGIKGKLCIFDRTGELIKSSDTGNIPVDICTYANLILISCSGEDVTALHARGDGRTMGWVKAPAMPDRLAVCPDNGRMYISSQLEDELRVIDLAGRNVLFNVKTGKEASALLFYDC